MSDSRSILLVVDSLGGGGAERAVLVLATGLVQLGHRVRILNLSGICDYPVPGSVIIVNADLSFSYRKAPAFIHKYESIVSDIEKEIGSIDLIFGNLPSAQSLLLASRCHSYSVVHNTVSEELQRLGGFKKRWRYKRFIKKAYRRNPVVCVSRGVRSDLIENFDIPPEACTTIYNPVDVGWIKLMAEREDDFFSQRPKNDYVVHVGRFCAQKRHDVLIKAFANADLDGDLVLLGTGPDEDAIRRLVCELGVEERVHFIGFTENPFPWMKNARLSVLSSDFEGFGCVIIESLACGTPVVSTDCPHGPREILGEDFPQCLCPPDDIQALAKKMSEIWHAPPLIDYFKILEPFAMKNIALKYASLNNTNL